MKPFTNCINLSIQLYITASRLLHQFSLVVLEG